MAFDNDYIQDMRFGFCNKQKSDCIHNFYRIYRMGKIIAEGRHVLNKYTKDLGKNIQESVKVERLKAKGYRVDKMRWNETKREIHSDWTKL